MINRNKPINVWVNPNPETAVYEIWVFETIGAQVNAIRSDGVRTVIPENATLKKTGAHPFMVIPFLMANYLFPELISALQTNTINFTPVPEATLKGELTATKVHLADMQKITDKLFTLLEK